MPATLARENTMTPSYRITAMAAACLAIGLGVQEAQAADPARPAVVELFTSQGCSSCPPANDNLAILAGRPEILALSFGVTYWDNLGWKDTFASPTFTARQWDYARSLRHRQVWTPQMVFNGRSDVTGASRGEIDRALRTADRGAGGPALSMTGETISVGAGRPPAGGADVWLVRYDPRTVQVPVRRGENSGLTLPHRNVVREFVRIGRWTGQPLSITVLRSHDRGLMTAVLLQAGQGGPIVAASKG